MKRKAPAKVNMCLEVVGRLPSGFHTIRTVMLKLPRLYDEVEVFVDTAGKGITVESVGVPVPTNRENICYQAAEAFLQRIRKSDSGVRVRINKTIPVAAGLGGGSSDAAATLLCLNGIFGSPVAEKELTRVATRLGKDVPFFLVPKQAAHMEGMGEKMVGSVDVPPLHVLVVNPGIRITTADAYRGLDDTLWYMNYKTRRNNTSYMFSFLRKRDTRGVAGMLYNDFELWTERKHPIIKEIKQTMMAFGAYGALMSGSGSTVFGVFPSSSVLQRARRVIARQYPGFFIAEG